MVLSLEIMPLEAKEPEPLPPKTMVVRYGYLREIGEFQSDLKTKVGCGSKLVIRTNRGTELAEMLTTVCGNGGCGKSITRDKLLDYIAQSGGEKFPFSDTGRILRVATAQDLARQRRLDEQKPANFTMARELVQQHKIPMKIVDVEYLLGGERIMFYFTSEHRVDFRSLVRDLAQKTHSRIELCQVGTRDEARLVADYDKCGQHCCCKQFLKVLTPISMRSAKVQRATLDPVKINGRCGRLMCCLRYEDQTYEELRKKLPAKNSRVRTPQGEGWVVDSQILTQLVLLRYDDGSQVAVPMENIEEFNVPRPKLPSGRVMQFPGDTDRTPAPPANPAGPGGQPQRSPQNVGTHPGPNSGNRNSRPGAPRGPIPPQRGPDQKPKDNHSSSHPGNNTVVPPNQKTDNQLGNAAAADIANPSPAAAKQAGAEHSISNDAPPSANAPTTTFDPPPSISPQLDHPQKDAGENSPSSHPPIQ